MGVAHNKSYFEWFELGRTEYCRRSGLPYGEVEARGYYLMVVEASCRYRKPLHYDEEFVIRVALAEVAGRRLVFCYELAAISDGRLVATGQTVHVPTNRRAEVCSLPDDILEKIMGAAA